MTGEAVTAHRIGPAGGPDPGGATVVFVHGIEDGWQSWRPLAGHLDPSWRCIALDLPWRAGNDYRWRRQRSPGGWLASVLDDLDCQPDVLVGHSFGAGAVLELLTAGLQPRAAALISPTFRRPDLEVTWRVFDRSRSYFEAQIKQGLLLRLGRRAAVIEPGLRDAIIGKAFDRIGPAGFLTVFDQFAASGDLDLASIKVPTLVLCGRKDPSLSQRGAAALTGLMPSAVVMREGDFDHFCHLRQTAAVAGRLTSFLSAAFLSAADGKGAHRDDSS
jgi:pimeloyl-ACP methyl ester carboxylesterase